VQSERTTKLGFNGGMICNLGLAGGLLILNIHVNLLRPQTCPKRVCPSTQY
jgi:hypothetical protein